MHPRDIADDLIAWHEQHRLECGDGPGCCEPANVLAFLAHCVGMRSSQEDIRKFQESLINYERTCPGCQHLRN